MSHSPVRLNPSGQLPVLRRSLAMEAGGPSGRVEGLRRFSALRLLVALASFVCATDGVLGVDTAPPACRGVPAGSLIDGTATEFEVGDTGIASVELSPDSANLVLEIDPSFMPGAQMVSFQVSRNVPAVGGGGTVVVTDLAMQTCTIPMSFTELLPGVVTAEELCAGENMLTVSGDPASPTPGGTSICSVNLPSSVEPPLPPGYEYPGNQLACRILTIVSPITNDTDMTYVKGGAFDPNLRLMFSQFDGSVFPPFTDVTESIEPAASSRMKGKGKWSQVKVACALHAEICNGLDDDGDGLIDEGLPVGDPSDDEDMDGFSLCAPSTGCPPGPLDCVD